MKKMIVAIAASAIMAFSAGCLAKVPASQIALGGVEPGMTVDAAKNLCGEPTYADGETLIFGNGLIVKVDDDRPGIVEEVIAREHGGIATPAGISVGMSESALTDAYGQADSVDRDHDGTEYKYHSDDRSRKMEFKVRNGVIVKISCEMKD